MKKYKEVLERQLSIDYDCTIEDIRSASNIFKVKKEIPDARPIGEPDSMLKVTIYNEKLLVMADEKLLPWCKEVWEKKRGTWFADPHNLVRINEKLIEFGQCLADTHHHYIPTEGAEKTAERFPIRWYEQEEIKVFRGDDRFDEALLFDESTPDMLAVCAMEGETILGMAAATRNTTTMWEIGVNVTKEGRGKGIGTYVTALLKDELLNRGIVPTYATMESHIKSQRVAFQSGFEPIFYELFSE